MIIFLGITGIVPSISFAEVSDKLHSQPELWLQGFGVGVVMLILCTYRPFLLILIWAPVVSLFGWATHELFADPYVGPAILQEQGMIYQVISYVSVLLVIAGGIIGFVLGLRKRTFFGKRRAES